MLLSLYFHLYNDRQANFVNSKNNVGTGNPCPLFLKDHVRRWSGKRGNFQAPKSSEAYKNASDDFDDGLDRRIHRVLPGGGLTGLVAPLPVAATVWLAFATVLEVEFVLAFAGIRLEAGWVALATRAGGSASPWRENP